MALQFERNLNLEEIDSDALFGIKYLSHQTTLQKIVFWSCTILSIVIYLVTQLVFKLPFIISFANVSFFSKSSYFKNIFFIKSPAS